MADFEALEVVGILDLFEFRKPCEPAVGHLCNGQGRLCATVPKCKVGAKRVSTKKLTKRHVPAATRHMVCNKSLEGIHRSLELTLHVLTCMSGMDWAPRVDKQRHRGSQETARMCCSAAEKDRE